MACTTSRLDDYADCLAGFIQLLDPGRPHVGGLSRGGGLALELYRRHPQVPRSLVLASAYAGWAGSLPPEVARDLHAKIPGSALVVLSGVGHQSDMEAPERFNTEVRGFLRSVQR
jgi:pimeloyl-ACP methyl ester carboxylesterase